MVNTKRSFAKKILKPESVLVLFLILSVVLGIIASPHFLDFEYILASMTQYIELGVIAIAFTFVLISGEIDLSVASAMTFTSCFAAVLYRSSVPMGLVIILALLFGVILGLINGALTAFTKINSLIITLGTMSLYRGLAQVLIKKGSIGDFPEWFVGIDQKLIFNFLPLSILIFLILMVIMEIILKDTFFGRRVFALGTNDKVALYSGIKIKANKIVLFGILGLFTGMAGVMQISRYGLAKYSLQLGGELDVITMVLLGGTAFSGGRGSTIGTALAFLVVVLIKISMTLINMERMIQLMIIGLILVATIIISDRLHKYQDLAT